VKKKRRAETALLTLGGRMPVCVWCSWNRRRSSAVAVSGDRPSSYLAVGAGAGSEEDRTHRERRQITAAWAEGRLCRQLKRSDRQHTSRHDQQQPPHVQAKNTYVEYLDEVGGRRFLVTMEEPSVAKPQPIVFEISGGGGKLALTRSGTVAIVSSPAPRAG
jgi:hypothetical protein